LGGRGEDGDVLRDLPRAGGGLGQPAAHLVRRRRLLLHRRGDGELEVVDGPDDAGDLVDLADGGARVALDRLDPAGDVLGGARGPLRELLGRPGNDGEALARLPGTGGLDGRVEGEEVGLLGDGGDDLDDVTDLLGGGAELAHGAVRRLRDGAGAGRDRGRLPRRARDLPDGGAHLLGSRGYGLHAGGDLLGGRRGGREIGRASRRERASSAVG